MMYDAFTLGGFGVLFVLVRKNLNIFGFLLLQVIAVQFVILEIKLHKCFSVMTTIYLLLLFLAIRVWF